MQMGAERLQTWPCVFSLLSAKTAAFLSCHIPPPLKNGQHTGNMSALPYCPQIHLQGPPLSVGVVSAV